MFTDTEKQRINDYANRLVDLLKTQDVNARVTNKTILGVPQVVLQSEHSTLVVSFPHSRSISVNPHHRVVWYKHDLSVTNRRMTDDPSKVAEALIRDLKEAEEADRLTLENHERSKLAAEWADKLRETFSIPEEGPVSLDETDYNSGEYVLKISGNELINKVLNVMWEAGIKPGEEGKGGE